MQRRALFHHSEGLRTMKRFLTLIAGALVALASTAPAHALNAPLTVSYVLPTVACSIVGGVEVSPCDNVPLTGANALTAVEMIVSTSPIPGTYDGPVTLSVPPSTTSANTTFVASNGDTLYVRVRARTANGVSDWSLEATKLVQVDVKPGKPTSVTITLNIT
jgi:hypothetical protein